ncbi:transglutaminase domain-containing protein [Roseimicrobium sp. ORNL1]|uniref:transglutaminase domain-containing protein n=1 Tax=Roseimicrobium sp. ORNL1 TaxID=2711231 RepID=UPI0013E17C85|nr:transglutaminase domain-containing protein [Roseimicrobium sp. ORNL1]QIF05615.1 transglutaminase domain-containing protein [Roseimicrobium sp. ORNL1]
MKVLRASLAASLLFVACSLQAAKPVKWEPWLETGGDVFPSLLIATATVDWQAEAEVDEDGEEYAPTFGDPNGWFGVNVSNVPANSVLKVEVQGDGWLKPSQVEVKIKKATEDLYITPKAVFNYEVLHQIREQKPVNLTFKVSLNGAVLGERNEIVTMHGLNDCPFWVDHGEEAESLDLSWMFAAYVNENHPWIDKILQEALQTGLVDSFTGYQSEDSEQVLTQVFAIWHVLQRKGIRYSDISTTPGAKTVYCQTVRFLDESLDATQANCVDGSVLMASLLRKIGITSYLVMVPGHCYLAFDTDAEGETTVGLETTMLGNDKLKPLKELPSMEAKLKKKEFATSLKTFKSAISTANEDLEENAEKFGDEEETDYQLINIQEARDFGIMPIASGRKRS